MPERVVAIHHREPASPDAVVPEGAVPFSIAFAGGGSGGHLSPGLAIAERVPDAWRELGRSDPPPGVLFLASQRDVDRAMLERAGVRWSSLPARPLHLRPAGAVAFVRAWPRAVRAARRALERAGARDLVALGGFVAAPAAVAAGRLGLRTTQMHLDRSPGRAGRLLARRCDRTWSACPIDGRDDPVLGMPVRRSAIADRDAAACRRRLGLDPERPVLLVTGASQGARSIDRLLARVARDHRDALDGWQVHHLAAATSVEPVRRAYAEAGVDALVEGFRHEMGPAWGAAALVIARAGASTVAEVEANHVPALFLPYPWHRDRHQERNAAPLVEAGAARCVEDRVEDDANAEHAGRVLTDLLRSRAVLAAMAEAAVARHVPDAALVVARRLLAAD